MDFTLDKYSELLDAFSAYGSKRVTLRHDVDLRPENSLETARIEAGKGWKATYYFRTVPESWNEVIIKQISELGHEIGYHYECLTTTDGDIDKAWEDFKTNLSRLSDLLGKPVRSICMHGSPRSPFDSRDIWKKYDYRKVGVEHESYLDTDFSKVFYLTDTGRRWDGYKVSVRDKIPQYQDKWTSQGLVFHSTDDVMEGLRLGKISSDVLVTTHPQRWNRPGPAWFKEYFAQNVKNIVKKVLIIEKNI